MRFNNTITPHNLRSLCAGFCASEALLAKVGGKVVYQAPDWSRAASTKGAPVQQ